MSKIEQAHDILSQLGMPGEQQNDIACLTLLALTNLAENDSWEKASKNSLTIHQMMRYMAEIYNRQYAENTRETVRRRVIHQFEQARIVDRNPDIPALPTNSPRTHYALTEAVLEVIRSFGTDNWKPSVEDFLAHHGALLEIYQRRRDMQLIPVRLSTGVEISLSPGKHNRLQALVVSSFGPRFAPGSLLLYLGDAAHKLLHVDHERLEELGVPVNEHDKLPDVLIYDEEKKWLFLVEAVTSHGPVTPKRRQELEAVLQNCGAGQIYVSVFLDFREFRRHVDTIAWETEVWIADMPDHLIHYNGDKFLGPR